MLPSGLTLYRERLKAKNLQSLAGPKDTSETRRQTRELCSKDFILHKPENPTVSRFLYERHKEPEDVVSRSEALKTRRQDAPTINPRS